MGAMTGRRACLLFLAAGASTAAAVAFTAWGPFPLRVDDWHWYRVTAPASESSAAPLVVYGLIGLVAVAAWQRAARLSRRAEVLVVSTLVSLAFAGQLLSARQLPGGYTESIIALGKPGANRYHAAACQVERLGPFLRDYHMWMRDPAHTLIVTHPAGPVTLFWLLNHAFAGSEDVASRFVRWCEDWLAGGMHVRGSGAPPQTALLFAAMSEAELAGVWLATFVLRLAACLVIVPVYALARRMHGVQAALVAAAFGAVIPSLILFSPGLDQAFPVVAATACWLAWTAGRLRSRWRAAGAGMTVSVGFLFSLSFGIVGLWAALLWVAGAFAGDARPERRDVVRCVIAAGAGFAALPLVAYIVLGYNSPAVWVACVRANAAFNLQSGRVYWKWVLVNPVDFLVFLGVPLACLFVARAGAAAKALWQRRVPGHDWPTLVVVGLLLGLNLLGVNRGEVSRLWMFLMPGCVVAAAGQIEASAPYRRVVFTGLFALQAIQATVFKSLVDVLSGMYRGLA